MNDDPNAWRTPQFRQRVIHSIENTMANSGAGITPKPPADMENQVFQKAKSKEEYLSLVAKLIVYVRESANQKKAAAAMGGPMGGPMPGMPPQDPINALQSMTKGPGGHPQSMHPQGTMAQGPMGGGMGPVMGPGAQQMMQGQPMMQQRAPFQNYQQSPGHRPMGPAMHAQSYGPSVMGQSSMGQSSMGQSSMGQPSMGQSSMGQSSMGQPSMVQSSMGQSSMGQPMAPQHSQGMQPQYGQNMMSSAMGMRQGTPTQQYQQTMPYSNPGMSPVGMTSHSPAMLPSPSQAAVSHSPASARPMQVPSPASVSLNTPQSGPVPSPADGKTGEELIYLEKLTKLQKYVEPLKRMINRIERDNDRKKDLKKMENLLDILTNPKKRLPMETLTKCQNVLEKLDLEFQKSAGSTSSTDTFTMLSSTPGQHMCQSLINTIASQIKQPMFNHTLKRTFGPAVDELLGPPIRAPSPPPKKRRSEESEDSGAVSDLLQGEIARLHHRFTVELDPLYHNQSKTVHLICKLDCKNLPTVPPIAVTVPENYPETSPLCETDVTGYDSTPFLQRVHKTLLSNLLHTPSRFSVTALLNLWEMSVRRATVSTSQTE